MLSSLRLFLDSVSGRSFHGSGLLRNWVSMHISTNWLFCIPQCWTLQREDEKMPYGKDIASLRSWRKEEAESLGQSFYCIREKWGATDKWPLLYQEPQTPKSNNRKGPRQPTTNFKAGRLNLNFAQFMLITWEYGCLNNENLLFNASVFAFQLLIKKIKASSFFRVVLLG